MLSFSLNFQHLKGRCYTAFIFSFAECFQYFDVVVDPEQVVIATSELDAIEY